MSVPTSHWAGQESEQLFYLKLLLLLNFDICAIEQGKKIHIFCDVGVEPNRTDIHG